VEIKEPWAEIKLKRIRRSRADGRLYFTSEQGSRVGRPGPEVFKCLPSNESVNVAQANAGRILRHAFYCAASTFCLLSARTTDPRSAWTLAYKRPLLCIPITRYGERSVSAAVWKWFRDRPIRSYTVRPSFASISPFSSSQSEPAKSAPREGDA